MLENACSFEKTIGGSIELIQLRAIFLRSNLRVERCNVEENAGFLQCNRLLACWLAFSEKVQQKIIKKKISFTHSLSTHQMKRDEIVRAHFPSLTRVVRRRRHKKEKRSDLRNITLTRRLLREVVELLDTNNFSKVRETWDESAEDFETFFSFCCCSALHSNFLISTCQMTWREKKNKLRLPTIKTWNKERYSNSPVNESYHSKYNPMLRSTGKNLRSAK